MNTCHSVMPLKVIFIAFPNQRLLAATERKRVENQHWVLHSVPCLPEEWQKVPIDTAVLPGGHSQFLRFVVIINGICRKSAVKVVKVNCG